MKGHESAGTQEIIGIGSIGRYGKTSASLFAQLLLDINTLRGCVQKFILYAAQADHEAVGKGSFATDITSGAWSIPCKARTMKPGWL
jgi:putative exporter of polyketide antibiotics